MRPDDFKNVAANSKFYALQHHFDSKSKLDHYEGQVTVQFKCDNTIEMSTAGGSTYKH